jgi:NADPH:quinone reductase-like Zn-dependent oxidoreductase
VPADKAVPSSRSGITFAQAAGIPIAGLTALPATARQVEDAGPNGGGSPDKNKSILGMIGIFAMGPFISQRVVFGVTKPDRANLQLRADMIEAGMVTPVIDTVYPLAGVAVAYRHLEAGHAHGKVVVTVQA